MNDTVVVLRQQNAGNWAGVVAQSKNDCELTNDDLYR